MHYIVAALAAAAVSLAPHRARTRQYTPEQTLDRAVAAYEKVKTARATFTQTLTNPLTGATTTSQGEVQQLRPSRFAVTFTEPAGDRIVADGKWLWVYLPSTNPGQVIKSPAGENGSGAPDVTAQFLESPRSKYRVADAGIATVAGRPTHALRLTPKDASLPFTSATIWVDDGDSLVRQFETTDANGVVRRVTIQRLTVNGKVDPSAFVFTVPKGVKVYENGNS